MRSFLPFLAIVMISDNICKVFSISLEHRMCWIKGGSYLELTSPVGETVSFVTSLDLLRRKGLHEPERFFDLILDLDVLFVI